MTLFEKYSYKQKNRALLVLAVLLFAVSYKRSFSKTVEMRSFLSELDVKISEGKASEKEARRMQRDINSLNKLLGKEDVSIEAIQQGFLNFFAQRSNNLTVNQIDEVVVFEHPDFKINTFKIDIRGNYLATLQFLNLFELLFENARLVHTHFETVKEAETEKKELITTLILQNYAQKN